MKEEIFKNKLFILESTKTNQPFLTQNGECLLFLDPKEATEMAKQYENVRVSDPKFYKIAEFYALCYAAGASSVVLGVGEKKENFLLDEKRNLPHRFYNHAMVKTVALLKQYGDVAYLWRLASCQFIIPVKIKEESESVRISYGAVRHMVETSSLLFLAFSNLEEFNLWNTSRGEWKPVLLSFRDFRKICGEHGFFLNPAGNRLIITPDLTKQIDQNIEKVKKNRAT
ncbi:SseB family protein [Blautia faecicola]|uniref:SseB family protein n=1 Tax=Blautia faecicola TaxID=2509240 RepID=A0A4Q1RDC4_9FIRM|nr:SseB family protein [Blautia faecicola]RXS72566.1 SseB family protein [Blautia faecicola]